MGRGDEFAELRKDLLRTIGARRAEAAYALASCRLGPMCEEKVQAATIARLHDESIKHLCEALAAKEADGAAGLRSGFGVQLERAREGGR